MGGRKYAPEKESKGDISPTRILTGTVTFNSRNRFYWQTLTCTAPSVRSREDTLISSFLPGTVPGGDCPVQPLKGSGQLGTSVMQKGSKGTEKRKARKAEC